MCDIARQWDDTLEGLGTDTRRERKIDEVVRVPGHRFAHGLSLCNAWREMRKV